MDLAGRPATDLWAAVQENVEQPHEARLMDFEARITDGADGDRAGEALKEGKVDMDVEPLGLVTGEAISNLAERVAHGIEVIEPLAQAEVVEVV